MDLTSFVIVVGAYVADLVEILIHLYSFKTRRDMIIPQTWIATETIPEVGYSQGSEERNTTDDTGHE